MSSGALPAHRFLRAYALLPLLFLGLFVTLAVEGGRRVVRLPFGAESLGFSLSFRLDGLSVLFGILISGVGLLIYLYASSYMAGKRNPGRFFLWLSLFMVSMIGMVCAENLIALFMFWELTSISSWFLIASEPERAEARGAALVALLVTAGGGMVMLAGFVLLASVAGSFELTAIFAQADLVRAHSSYVPILLLIAVGAFTKSAQFPFHFWLPAAMEAPTPVSAYLHSATMVKAGVFLLARLLPLLGGTLAWSLLLGAAGIVTMVTGAFLAVFASDIKKILAYSTISALGSMVLLIGIGAPAAVQAMIVFLVAHALYKAALFMVGGIIDHETGCRDVDRLGALRRTMPLTAIAAVLGAISLASFGPVLSFAGKEMVILAIAGSGAWSLFLQGLVYGTSMFLAAAAALVAFKPFFGKRPESDETSVPHDPPPLMWMPPLLLSSAGIALGLFPYWITRLLLDPAAAAVHPDAGGMQVALWHGVNVPLLIAAAATAAGVVLFHTRQRWLRLRSSLEHLSRFGPAAAWESFVAMSLRFAEWQARILQNGYLRVYLLVIIVTLMVLNVAAIGTADAFRFNFVIHDALAHELFVSALILAGALTAVRSRSRLGSIAALGVVGYSVALMYILFSAPDLAMTQFLIETLTVIIFVLVIYRLPRYALLTDPITRGRDIVICTLAGALISALVLVAARESPDPGLSRFYAANALEQAHGRNIVNVILVDFRALDTLGEITVLAVAAVGVLALLRLRPVRGRA
ncbi:MAG TPA: hydrogen gas-evolving membrane-bound hydrogenase subunit E [Thermoanaerobaculia bacterium]|nr:hydrogen gas-evolving membrane-bound hydrogenase subunit E [Thermoanaerobaculia bacterium]